MELVQRLLRVKTYHPIKGDALIDIKIMVRPERALDDPWFGQRAKQLTRRFGKVVEWRVYA